MKQTLLRCISVLFLVSMLFSTGSFQNAHAAATCTPASPISVPFSKDGAGDFCYVTSNLCTFINSWNMTTLEVNGTPYTNIWVSSPTIPPVGSTYTIHYVGPYAWSHFEIGAPCGGNPTNTPVAATPTPTATRTNTSIPPTNTPVAATATRTNTSVPPTNTALPPTATSGPSSGLKVQYKAADTNATDNQVKPHFTIVNGGASSVALSSLKIRYYFSENTTQAFTTYCDYAVVNCANVTTSITSMSPVTGADHYLEVGFTAGAGSITAGGNSGEIQTRFNKNDWSNFNESDDYSFDPTKTAFSDWSQVTLYNNGTLVWGTAPGGNPPATNTPTGPTSTPTNTPTAAPTVDPHQVVNTYGRLQISTTALKDQNGNAIQLHGMDSHGLTWFPLSDLNLNNTSNINTLNQQITFSPAQGTRFPYSSSAVGNLVTQWHIQVIKTTMFPYDPWNGVNAKSYDNNYPAWKWYNINLVNSIVQAAIDQNIYVIIDWHAGEGNDPDPNVYWTNGHVQEFFTYMVDKWGSYPNVIYQTVNSPNNISWASLKTYDQNVINLIRSRETADGYAADLIIAGTPTWSQDVDIATNDPLTGNLIAYNFMWYAGTHGASIRSKADTALANLTTKAPNQTLFMSEVGTTQSTGTGGIYYSEFNTWLEWAKTKKLSWLNWSISNKQEDSAIFVPAILGNVPNNEIAWRGGDGASIAEALASTGFPMRMGPWADADYSCSGKFIRGWIMNNTSQSVPAGC